MSANEKRQPKPFGNYAQEYWKTLKFTAEAKKVSRELYQREIPLLYQKALHFLDLFAEKGYIAKGKPEEEREVYITLKRIKN